ncbi:MAG: HAMP domain-containing histidine kinase, partial [Clostridia bacterium]|nr:HAMP domain-containing histidine kinase [Clostridia bacterium]
IAVLMLTLLIADRFLSRGVLNKIHASLEQLSQGLRKLREGDLACRLPENAADEFSGLRADFNATAAQLQQSVAQVRESEKNRQELLAGISHDLRSPLTSIRAYADGLLDGVAQTPEAQIQYLTIIRDKTRDLQALVNKLFLFSRMDLGENADHPEPVSLRDELGLLCRTLAPEYAEKGLVISLSCSGEGRVMADPDTLHRILSNVAENSLKYKAASRGRLDISLSETPQYVSLTLRDDGPGVPREALPHLFDAFYRADPSRSGQIPGSGLGLAIVSRAVRNMRGRIIARNAEPHGLLLEIQLPRLAQLESKEV